MDLAEESRRWDEAYQYESLRLSEPAASVIRFYRLYLDETDGPLLDLGCGYGRHTAYFCEEGRQVVGVDLSAAALSGAGQRLAGVECGHHQLIRAEFASLPLAAESIAGGVSIRSIYHGTSDYVLASLQEVFRVLQHGGEILVNFLSDRNSLFGKGEQLGPKTFRIFGGVDSGAPHLFFNQSDVQRISAQAGFQLRLLKLEEYYTEDGERSSSWFAQLRKP